LDAYHVERRAVTFTVVSATGQPLYSFLSFEQAVAEAAILNARAGASRPGRPRPTRSLTAVSKQR
jgi:hypothetical protein